MSWIQPRGFDLHLLPRHTFGLMKAEAVTFTTKGQIVIPARIRRLFEIKEGTTAAVTVTPEGILLRPVTRAYIHSLRGKYAKNGPSTADLEAERRKDRAREDR